LSCKLGAPGFEKTGLSGLDKGADELDNPEAPPPVFVLDTLGSRGPVVALGATTGTEAGLGVTELSGPDN